MQVRVCFVMIPPQALKVLASSPRRARAKLSGKGGGSRLSVLRKWWYVTLELIISGSAVLSMLARVEP